MAVPNTTTFTLLDVKNNVTGSPNTLLDAFAAATPIAFDATYSGAKDRLLNFRNYDEGGGGGNELTLSESYIEFEGNAGTWTAELTSNTSWSVTSSDPSWLQVGAPTSGSGNSTIGGFRTQNNTGVLRSATITVQTTSGTPSITRFIIIDQEPFD